MPSREELDRLPRNEVNNYSRSGNMSYYWTSTETTWRITRSSSKDTGEYKLVYYRFNYDDMELSGYKDNTHGSLDDARARLCRVL